ncbi:hypothetical protein [Reyranella sp.]|uniref:hypothetical protein n=1 Tax=Reyranella sp. TaxID=1929291 RepID=UPI00272EF676|nr:hypothetical protein [Reyranella sp.]MDP2372131.1 hypothetical protein [Reyranella sp.]
MSRAKDAMMERDEDHNWAIGYLVSLGVLEECEPHEGTYFDGSGDLTGAYKKANTDISNGTIPLRKGQTRTDITDLLKAAYDDNSGVSKCPICEKNMRD